MSESTNLPSTKLFGEYNADDDFKAMRSQDKILPRLRLAQYTADLVKNRTVEAGAWYDSSNNSPVVKPNEVGKIVPLMFWFEWNEWNPDKSAPPGVGAGKAILNRSLDPMSALAKSAERFEKIQTTKGERVKVTEYYSFLVLAPEYFGNYYDMLLLAFSKTGHKIGKQWLNRMNAFYVKAPNGEMVRAPMAAVAWDLGRAVAKSADGEYFVPSVGAGTLLDPAVREITLQQSAIVKQKRAEIANKNAAAEPDTKEADTEL